ncbi:hypothetical protein BU14_0575s0009 [Porphyra umbilicalis]|uniref:Uncharacterized protein n=1 Tax=Porphyra umbilicalis TaxID=2786 RepID=A0A1X6NRL5_PORUM|nr:hypothetical protein BU14_0575s0009 [Porphyra umbilicalis]|eukprot:OSX71222.1 hypothetical protein BU14_0575s0009 [Porphyra umbilicalis]
MLTPPTAVRAARPCTREPASARPEAALWPNHADRVAPPHHTIHVAKPHSPWLLYVSFCRPFAPPRPPRTLPLLSLHHLSVPSPSRSLRPAEPPSPLVSPPSSPVVPSAAPHGDPRADALGARARPRGWWPCHPSVGRADADQRGGRGHPRAPHGRVGRAPLVARL